MIVRKSWSEFRATGLIWFINRTLHLFGWAIVFEMNDKNEVVGVYPVRTVYRGFSQADEEEGFIKVSTYLKNNIEQLEKEAKS